MVLCRRINDRNSFFVYPYEEQLEKSEPITTSDLMKQLENLSVSTSDYEPSTKVPKIKIKKKRTSFSKLKNDEIPSTDEVDSRDLPWQGVQSHDDFNEKEETHDVSNNQKSQDSNTSDRNSLSDDGIDTKDLDWNPDGPSELAEKKKSQRRKKTSKDCLKSVLAEIPEDIKTEVLMSNELISLEHIKENIRNLQPDEFLTKQLHIMCIDKKWSEMEIRAYANYFHKKPSYMMELAQINCLKSIGHRKSYNQQYKQEQINLIRKYILENAMPSANCERDIVMKRKSLIQNRSKRLFYE